MRSYSSKMKTGGKKKKKKEPVPPLVAIAPLQSAVSEGPVKKREREGLEAEDELVARNDAGTMSGGEDDVPEAVPLSNGDSAVPEAALLEPGAKGKRSRRDVLQMVSDAVPASKSKRQAAIKVNQRSERSLFGVGVVEFRVFVSSLSLDREERRASAPRRASPRSQRIPVGRHALDSHRSCCRLGR